MHKRVHFLPVKKKRGVDRLTSSRLTANSWKNFPYGPSKGVNGSLSPHTSLMGHLILRNANESGRREGIK